MMDDIAALNIRVAELEARVNNHETRLPPEPKCDDPNFAYTTQLSYWVRALNPATPNTMNSGSIGYDGPYDRQAARTRAQAVASERAKHYDSSSPEPWAVRTVSWKDDWQAINETGIILVIEMLEVNGRVTRDWHFSNNPPSWLDEIPNESLSQKDK
jgi:hypothetical protein